MLPFQTVGKHCRDTFFILSYIEWKCQDHDDLEH